MSNNDRMAVVVFSGGMDSTTLLWQIKKSHDMVRALSFDYGQRHKVELGYAKKLAKVAGVPWDLIDMSELAKHLKGSSQTDMKMEVPHGHYTDESMKLTVVPNRNMIMLAAAVGYAIGQGFGKVCFAAHSGDHDIYPDCREKFVSVLRHAITLATEWTPVKLWAPFVHMTKADICAEGARLGVPFELTWSCYDPQSDFMQFSPQWFGNLTTDWFAGFVEGEGSFTHKTKEGKRYASFSITQKDRGILEDIKTSLDFGSVSVQRGHPRDTWQYGTSGGNVCRKIAWLLNGRMQSFAKEQQFRRWVEEFDLLDDRNLGHCGKCGTCVERVEAFKLAEVEDPTKYQD